MINFLRKRSSVRPFQNKPVEQAKIDTMIEAMPPRRQIRDVMVPIAEYTTTSEDRSLKNAVLDLRKIFCDVDTGEFIEAGHCACLVLDENSELVGIIDWTVQGLSPCA